jgi:hypothetical protein
MLPNRYLFVIYPLTLTASEAKKAHHVYFLQHHYNSTLLPARYCLGFAHPTMRSHQLPRHSCADDEETVGHIYREREDETGWS